MVEARQGGSELDFGGAENLIYPPATAGGTTAMRMKFTLALLFVLMLLYQPAYSPGQNRNDDDIVRVRTRVVFVDTLVQDKKTGAPIADLARESFQVLAEGKVRTLSYFSRWLRSKHWTSG